VGNVFLEILVADSPIKMKTTSRASQRARILALLTSARGAWVPLPTILELKISQFGARIFELRRLGLRIVNRTSNIDGVKHSWYRLEPGPVAPSPSKLPAPHFQESPTPGPRSLFAEVAPERLNYPD
jgi:hypothetical protein